MTFTLATENTRKCYQASFPIFRTGLGNDATLVAEIRYNKPLSQLSLLDRDELCKTVKDYHTLIKILPEMDQFYAGLQMLGVLDMLRKYPEIMQPLFIQAGPMKKLDKGKGVWCCRLLL